jgi:hypothetical protein
MTKTIATFTAFGARPGAGLALPPPPPTPRCSQLSRRRVDELRADQRRNDPHGSDDGRLQQRHRQRRGRRARGRDRRQPGRQRRALQRRPGPRARPGHVRQRRRQRPPRPPPPPRRSARPRTSRSPSSAAPSWAASIRASAARTPTITPVSAGDHHHRLGRRAEPAMPRPRKSACAPRPRRRRPSSARSRPAARLSDRPAQRCLDGSRRRERRARLDVLGLRQAQISSRRGGVSAVRPAHKPATFEPLPSELRGLARRPACVAPPVPGGGSGDLGRRNRRLRRRFFLAIPRSQGRPP